MSFAAHVRTVWPVVRRLGGVPAAPTSEPWSVEVPDPDLGSVRLSGRLRVRPGSRRRGADGSGATLLLLVHGLGGSAESSYMLRTARVADELGLSTLRLNLRGADGRGEDFYHAGLCGDLDGVLASEALADFERILLFGFSLGGHIGLRFATEVTDPRLCAVAAASSPLDLDRSVAGIDRPAGWVYRRYVLAGLCRMYAEVAARRQLPVSVAKVRRIRSLREWDRQTIVPRFGFANAGDYYRRAGVGSRLDRLRVPALLVVAEDDPMVPREAVAQGLTGSEERLSLRWVRRGGHLAFAADLDLGESAPKGLADQVIAWLQRVQPSGGVQDGRR